MTSAVDALVALVASKLVALERRFSTLARTPGPKGEPGDPGERGPAGVRGADGERGPQGERGPIGETGARGPDGARGEKGERGPQGERGERGPAGPRGPHGEKGDTGEQGPKGDTGDAPDHEWNGTKLRFRKPGGTWGVPVDLRGSAGVGGGGGGSRFDPAALPELPDTPESTDYLVLVRDGVAFRVSVAALQSVLGGGGGVPANAATVNGDVVTVNGENVTVTE